MKEQLNFEEAYNESVAYRNLGGVNASTADLDEISLRMDSSRAILGNVTSDEKLSELVDKCTTPYYFKIGKTLENHRTAISYAVSDMPYIDPVRAIGAYKYGAERREMTGYGERFLVAAGLGLKALTLIDSEATIGLWRNFHYMGGRSTDIRGRSLRSYLDDDLASLTRQEDFNPSEEFKKKVLYRNVGSRTPQGQSPLCLNNYYVDKDSKSGRWNWRIEWELSGYEDRPELRKELREAGLL